METRRIVAIAIFGGILGGLIYTLINSDVSHPELNIRDAIVHSNPINDTTLKIEISGINVFQVLEKDEGGDDELFEIRAALSAWESNGRTYDLVENSLWIGRGTDLHFREEDRDPEVPYLSVDNGDVVHNSAESAEESGTIWVHAQPGDELILYVESSELDCWFSEVCDSRDSGTFWRGFRLPTNILGITNECTEDNRYSISTTRLAGADEPVFTLTGFGTEETPRKLSATENGGRRDAPVLAPHNATICVTLAQDLPRVDVPPIDVDLPPVRD